MLIIGAGTSGIDLVIHLSKVTTSVALSRKSQINETEETRIKYQKSLPPNTVIIKSKGYCYEFHN